MTETTIACRVFEGERVSLDGVRYLDCIFRRCEIVYRGEGSVGLDGNDFEYCRFTFEGPAANALAFLQALHGSDAGGRRVVEETFERIRSGEGLRPPAAE